MNEEKIKDLVAALLRMESDDGSFLTVYYGDSYLMFVVDGARLEATE